MTCNAIAISLLWPILSVLDDACEIGQRLSSVKYDFFRKSILVTTDTHELFRRNMQNFYFTVNNYSEILLKKGTYTKVMSRPCGRVKTHSSSLGPTVLLDHKDYR